MALDTGLVRAGCCHGCCQSGFCVAGFASSVQKKNPVVPVFCLFSGVFLTVSTSVRHEGFEPPTF